ncbi:MAG: exonuclease SbcCD subunit D C-terminal domain-containing protein [Lentisphaeria bacterium]|nr:exonuclease SbcCD subunit D C-terminal domain-containing protein [Lentisphaeria bacterium]
MKILHTADWHLGASLGNARRYTEFDRMLDHLLHLAEAEKIDCVILAGDIFDVPVPPNRAIEQYYRFLTGCAAAGVSNCIIIAGNHDSPSFIEAPKELLKRLNVHVVGRFDREDPASHLIVLEDQAVVAAIPYLHERDVRNAVSGETHAEQQHALRTGIVETYRQIAALAKKQYPALPLIATGHFWAVQSGNDAPPVGNAVSVPLNDFPEEIAYLALGHIHGGYPVKEHCYYSGSILQMNFDEAKHEKSVLIIDTEQLSEPPHTVTLPVFQPMQTITGTMEEIQNALKEISDSNTWLRIENTGPFEPDLRTILLEWIDGTDLQLISCGNREPNPAIIRRAVATEKLSDLTPETVFLRLLKTQDLTEEEQAELLDTFHLTEEAVRLVEREEKAE